jgi:uncharacterized membrane protein
VTDHAAPARTTYATERLGALSDGVFAIVLTPLVLDLKIPDLPAGFTEQRMIEDLEQRIPNFLAWLISFTLLARFWIVHHAIIATLARCHTGTMIWNFVVLGLVSLLPFAAALIGTYEYDPVAVAVFATTLGAIGLAIGLLARHARDETHLHRGHPGDEGTDVDWHWKYHGRMLPLFAAASLLLLAVQETAAVAIWLFEPAAAWIGSTKRRR